VSTLRQVEALCGPEQPLGEAVQLLTADFGKAEQPFPGL
jgi:hypothetical protein